MDKKPTGRPRTTRNPENIKHVRITLTRNSRRWVQKNAAALPLSKTAVYNILSKDLNFTRTKFSWYRPQN